MPALRALAKTHDIAAVVTQPEKPAGRGLDARASAVAEAALHSSLPLMTPARLDAAFVGAIAGIRPQLLACAAYGKILPAALLAIDGMVALNVHPSLLPRYRGAAPIQAALRNGEARTGVTIIWMTPEMDAGDIALQREVEIEPDEDYGSLHGRLSEVGASLLAQAADQLAVGTLPRVPQDASAATFTKPISKADLRIDDRLTAAQVVGLVRSASPSPGAWTMLDGKRIKVLAARAEPDGASAPEPEGPAVRVSDGLVRLLRVVPEGKRAMSGAEYVRGQRGGRSI